MGLTIVKYSGSQDLSGGTPLTLVTTPDAAGRTSIPGVVLSSANRRRLNLVTVHAASGDTTVQTVTTSRLSAVGSDYDAVLDEQAVSFGQSDYRYVPVGDVYCGAGDDIQVTVSASPVSATVVAAVIEMEE